MLRASGADTVVTLDVHSALVHEAAGAREITVITTHGVFTGTAWQRLWSLGVRRIYVTDSTPLPEPLRSCEAIVVLPIAPLLASALRAPTDTRTVRTSRGAS